MPDSQTRDGTTLRIPVIAYVSAGEPFSWTDQGYETGNGFDFIAPPPGLVRTENLYAVRVRGDSMRPLFKDGATLIVKPETRQEVSHEDFVIFKDQDYSAWVKMVLFHNGGIILRSLNQAYPDIVKNSEDIVLMDKIVFHSL